MDDALSRISNMGGEEKSLARVSVEMNLARQSIQALRRTSLVPGDAEAGANAAEIEDAVNRIEEVRRARHACNGVAGFCSSTFVYAHDRQAKGCHSVCLVHDQISIDALC